MLHSLLARAVQKIHQTKGMSSIRVQGISEHLLTNAVTTVLLEKDKKRKKIGIAHIPKVTFLQADEQFTEKNQSRKD